MYAAFRPFLVLFVMTRIVKFHRFNHVHLFHLFWSVALFALFVLQHIVFNQFFNNTVFTSHVVVVVVFDAVFAEL